MGMVVPIREPKWEDTHTEVLRMMYVQYEETSSNYEFVGPAPSIRVCKTCKKSKSFCSCAWRHEA